MKETAALLVTIRFIVAEGALRQRVVRTAVAVAITCALSASAQQPPDVGVIAPPPTATTAPAARDPMSPFYLEIGAFYSSLSRGYGDFYGTDLRLFYTTPRATPIVSISRQTHDGSQWNFGLSSYITFNERFYAIVGAGVASSSAVALYPKRRFDAALLGSVASVPGLVLSGGLSDIAAEDGGGVRIYSVGALYYRGRAVAGGSLRFNRDRLSGAPSSSQQLGIQYGEQGKYWVGASFTHGTEAYQLVGPTPVDVRFQGVGASAFMQRWVTRRHGFILRYDFEHKYTAFVRSGGAITYFVDF